LFLVFINLFLATSLIYIHLFKLLSYHANIIDTHSSNPLATYYDTVARDKIIFHDEEDEDPDWKVRQCYLLLIAAATEPFTGVENLLKYCRSKGHHNYPDFGKYMPINYYKAFCSASPYAWADPKYWYLDARDNPWDIFTSCFASFNEKRQRLLKTMLLSIDASMSSWRPETKTLSGLPNCTFEPRKPVRLGTMFCNGVEYITGFACCTRCCPEFRATIQKGLQFCSIQFV
jgi:hypothetical protein